MRNLHFGETEQLNSRKKVAIDTIREVQKIKYPQTHTLFAQGSARKGWGGKRTKPALLG